MAGWVWKAVAGTLTLVVPGADVGSPLPVAEEYAVMACSSDPGASRPSAGSQPLAGRPQRISTLFPPGTSAAALRYALASSGYDMHATPLCAHDPTVHAAGFIVTPADRFHGVPWMEGWRVTWMEIEVRLAWSVSVNLAAGRCLNNATDF